MAFYGSLGEVNFDNLDASIVDTAVDVFVYDTRKDSDGGAWRNRTQHTSWYNETLNTATRGSRREFPAVAVITVQNAETNTDPMITIYDGDDPDLPMWMVFRTNISGGGNDQTVSNLYYAAGPYQNRKVSMLNGVMVDCQFRSSGHIANLVKGVTRFNFIDDTSIMMTDEGDFKRNGNLGDERNTVKSYTKISTTTIVHTQCNDVAMTVLPNAPIDSTTGLPIPTIAVATDGGLSVIRDDGTVVNYTRGGNEYTGSVAFDELNNLIISWGTSSGGYRHATRITNPFVGSTIFDITYGYIASDLGMGGAAAGNTGGVVTVANSGRHFGIDFDSSSGVPAVQNNHDDRVNFLHINDADTTKSLVAYATASYNTGWMHGSIKGAFLSDTDATNVSAVVVNASTGDWSQQGTYNWTITSATEITVSSVAAGKSAVLRLTTDSSKHYVYSFNITVLTDNLTFRDDQNDEIEPIPTSTGVYTGSFTGTSYVDFTVYQNDSATVTDIDIREAEEDRSVNAKGLQVFGTITKSAVATGAELVAYSGFSNSTNYLSQPLNSDLAIGNNDFSCVGWFKKFASSNTGMIFYASSGNSHVFDVRVHTDMKMLTQITDDNFSTRELVSSKGPTVNDNIWHQFHVVRRSNILYSYLDGNLLGTSASVEANITDPMGITIGAEGLNANQKAFEGSISLIRFSKSAPSQEQIKKIYEDEKVLFQENAACTLYGSSDAVTALAYDEDTDLLHVGTSSGRSDFQGLRRINNTTTAVTTAISASDGLIVEQ